MLSNYFKVTYRNLIKFKIYSSINVISLGIGLACSIFLLVYIQDELSYDTHHPDYEQMFRIRSYSNGNANNFTQIAFGKTLDKEYDDIIATRVHRNTGAILKINGIERNIPEIYHADKTFPDVYALEFLEGDKTSLRDHNSVILSERAAKQFFENPIGQTIGFGKNLFTVTGIYKTLPENTHAKYDIIFNSYHEFSWVNESIANAWDNNYPHTYARISKNLSHADLLSKLDQFADKYVRIRPGIKADYKYVAQAISDIHLSGPGFDYGTNSSYSKIYLMAIICLMVLLIACINFMNLSTALAGKRSKEVGMRKTLGASKKELISQFLGESLLLTFLAFCIAFLLVELFLPQFNQQFNKTFASLIDFQAVIFLYMIALYFLVGIGAGLYPAFYLSRFNPIDVLKGTSAKQAKGQSLRKALVILQFSMSTILVIAATIIVNQIDYLKSQPLGYENENLTIIDLYHETFRSNPEVLKEKLQSSGLAEKVSLSTHVPAMYYWGQPLWLREFAVDESITLESAIVDHDFFETYNIKFVKGRAFSKDFSTDYSSSIILNEAAIKRLGLSGDPIGQTVYKDFPFEDAKNGRKIIGVIKDFHSDPLNSSVAPLQINLLGANNRNFITVKRKADTKKEQLEAVFNELHPGKYFLSYDAKNDLSFSYKAEENVASMVRIFGFLAIVISCAGLFGLVSFTAEQKTKEIGIRKVLGANKMQLISIFIREFGFLILIANLIACPIAYYFMESWLSNFAYRLSMGPLSFIIAIFISILIASITISYQVYKSSLEDPIQSLRYE